MTAEAVPAIMAETANERLKRTFESWFWGSMIVATIVHAGTFAFWPEMQTEDFSFTSEELEAIELPPEIEIPPPPQQIARPATPRSGTNSNASVGRATRIHATARISDTSIDCSSPRAVGASGRRRTERRRRYRLSIRSKAPAPRPAVRQTPPYERT